MTATDELRKLLDERGVEWRDTGKRLNMGNGVRIPIQTEYEQSCGGRWSTATEALSGTLTVNNLTPEQAIAATLGRGTCHMEQIPECRYDDIECDECGVCLWGFFMDKPGEGVCSMPNYCPYCGRAVEQ